MRKVVLSLVVSLVLISGSVGIATAQTAPATPKEKYDSKAQVNNEVQQQISGAEKDTPSLEKTTYETNNKLLSDWLCRLTECLKNNEDSSKEKSSAYGTSVVASLTNTISQFYGEPPASTQMYVADVLHSMGVIATPAYAQGLGFASLNPVLNAWKTFRNVAYFFFIIIFIIIGFMIMLRQKISSQAAVTAQQAIPHIVVALLFVTFSYAIAGLLIDAMYVVMYFLINIFGKNDTLIQQNFLGLGGLLLTGSTFTTAFSSVEAFVTNSLGGSEFSAAAVTGVIGGLVASVVIAIAVAIGIFRLFFELLKTYISILLSIALAPIILMMGAIPGKNTFGPWLKSLVANLAAFPTVVLVLILYDELTGAIYSTGVDRAIIQDGGFLPPYLAGSGVANTIPFLVGLGMILIMPELVTQAKKAFGATGGVFEQLGQAVGESVKRGWTGDAELVPGLGFTNLAKSPLTKWAGGLSGQNIARKTTIAGAGLAGFAPRAAYVKATERGSSLPYEMGRGFRRSVLGMGNVLGDPQWSDKKKDEKKS